MLTKPPQKVIEAAIEAGRKSWCAKDQRGAAVFHHDPGRYGSTSKLVVAAANGPAPPFKCSGSAKCRAACGKLAVHAEERALFQWERALGPTGPDVVHIAVPAGDLPRPSGPPSCVTCSRTMLLHSVAGVWLWHAEGWRRYPVVEFHELSLQHPKNQLPVIR